MREKNYETTGMEMQTIRMGYKNRVLILNFFVIKLYLYEVIKTFFVRCGRLEKPNFHNRGSTTRGKSDSHTWGCLESTQPTPS
jgi:hypothetical protein